MTDFKNEYKAAMNDITPDEALLDKIREDIKNKLDEPPSKKSIFLSFKPAFSAASLLIAVGAVTVAAILVMSPVNKGKVSDGSSNYYSNGTENDSDNYILADNVVRSVVTYSEDPFSMCVPLSRLSYIADNLEACKFDYFKQYASVIKENGAFSITFFCDSETTELIKMLYGENYTDVSGSMAYMVRVYFYIDDDDSEPFSIQVSRNVDKDKGAFDGKKGIDLVTSADKLQDFLDGNYDEPFNNMTVQ